MPTPRLLALFLLLAAEICCSPARAQQLLPTDWLATLTLQEPLEFLPRLQRLTGELSLPGVDAALLHLLATPELNLAGGSVTAGVAAPEGDLEQLYVFVVTPTPPAALVRAFNGDLTGDIGIFSAGGLEFAARARSDMTLVVPIDRQAILQFGEPAAAEGAAGSSDHDLLLRLSEQGLAQLRLRVEHQAAHRGRGGRVALNEMGWPPSARWIDAAIGGNLPLAERVAELFDEVSFGATLSRDGIKAEVVAVVSAQSQPSRKPSAASPSPRLPAPSRPPIATVSGDARDGSLRTLLSLWLAYSRGRPDELEASSYPAALYAEFESHVLAAADLVTSVDARLLTRGLEDPFYSNQALALGIEDPGRFSELLTNAAAVWNQTVEASDARVKLRLQVDQQPLLGGAAPLVTRFVSDLGTALEDPPSADTQAIMRRYYGENGLHVAKLAVVADHGVLVADVPDGEFREIASAAQAGGPAGRLAGKLWLDRYAAWQNAILSDYMADAIGFTEPKTLPEAPLAFSISQSDGAWRAGVTARRETLLDIVRLLLPATAADQHDR